MKVEFIETLLVCVIVSVQLYVFYKTLMRIRVFQKIIPETSQLKISKLLIPMAHLEKFAPKDLLTNITRYKRAYINAGLQPNFDKGNEIEQTTNLIDQGDSAIVEQAEVNIIEAEKSDSAIFNDILFSVNNYLIRNRGAATDFNLIKDIVERNTDAVEEDINLSIAVPLYLGLMGTMIGIVIGLFNMPDLNLVVDTRAKDLALNAGISLLIGGVKIAMIASFTGLLFTIISSGWAFKGSKIRIEAGKNQLYTFIQIELLPIINQGLAATLESLQRNLLMFNTEFATNLKQLKGVFDSNVTAIKTQKDLIETIEKAKMAEMSQYNIRVLQQMEVSVKQFEKFNAYMTNVNSFVDNSQQIVTATNEILERTGDFETIAGTISNSLNQGQQLLEFLSAHFRKLEDHKEFTANAVADVGFAISATFKELKEHIQNSSEAVKRFTVDEMDSLKKVLTESRSNLSNLEHLATINTDVTQFKNSTASQGERTRQQLDELNINMTKAVTIMQDLVQQNAKAKSKNVMGYLKGLLKSK